MITTASMSSFGRTEGHEPREPQRAEASPAEKQLNMQQSRMFTSCNFLHQTEQGTEQTMARWAMQFSSVDIIPSCPVGGQHVTQSVGVLGITFRR